MRLRTKTLFRSTKFRGSLHLNSSSMVKRAPHSQELIKANTKALLAIWVSRLPVRPTPITSRISRPSSLTMSELTLSKAKPTLKK
jgi:hypothetical protein